MQLEQNRQLITKKQGFRGPVDENGRPLVGQSTRFKPGEVANPTGRPKKLPLTEAYDRLLTPTQANRLARKAIEQAAKGSLGHLVEITDRVEGRVAQKHEVSGVVSHELTITEKQSALKSLTKLAAYDSDAENPIEAEFTDE